MRLRIDLGYDGTDFFGWQIQKDVRTVQGVLEEAFSKVLERKVRVIGSGRTDTGVHARHQVASLDLEDGTLAIPVDRLKEVFNSYLPKDVRVYEVRQVGKDFHPQFSAKGKVYRYFFFSGWENPVLSRYALWLPERDLFERLKGIVGRFSGRHDFLAFTCRNNTEVEELDTVRDLECGYGELADLFYLEFRARGFLYRMVRRLVGLALEIAQGRFEESIIDRVFAGETVHWTTAPANGLFLWEVIY